MVENLSAKAEHMGSICGVGRFHMPQGNKACAPGTTTEPMSHSLLKPMHPRACVLQ